MKPLTSIHATLITLALTASAPAAAGVQFRISHETSSNEYVVYMTPDTVPTPDMALSAQVSLVVPRSTDGNGFVYARHGHELMGCKSPVGEPTVLAFRAA
ncbi:hypothetical protein [Thiothrix subterranea]|uniref:Uncharacterized protein n=1 Tax=Thiothrix subterranea TaxID=2735563 RepID=A0AA51MPB2_9GAMM|nr:hypothetical protein [Thiothrix subterranea]MDQ5770131.1 hypothetical protein [Thiothrix subterranea]WML87389.1 hypothetical protein RCG00_03295 [Thiothrix subterranea]